MSKSNSRNSGTSDETDTDQSPIISQGSRRLGNFQCLDARFEIGNTKEKTIILFHGFGADAYDLQTLAEVIQSKSTTQWIFPQGHLEVPIGPGWTGRAWWPVDMQAIQEAAARGQSRDMSEVYPAELEKIRPQILKMIEQLKTPWEQIILGGFSQGAMLATDIFLNAPTAPKGLIIFSGQLICKDLWTKLAPTRKGKNFFMSHGEQDAVLSLKGAQQLETILTQAGLKGSLLKFRGGHEIPMHIVKAAEKYIETL